MDLDWLLSSGAKERDSCLFSCQYLVSMAFRVEFSRVLSVSDGLWLLHRRVTLRILFEVKYHEDNCLLCCLQEYAQSPDFLSCNRHRILGCFIDVSTWLFFDQGFLLALVAMGEVCRRISASVGLIRHSVPPPNRILSVLWLALYKKLLAGFVLHGPSIGNLFRRILRANAHIRTRYQNVIDMRKPIDRVLHALRSTSAEAEETSISPSSLRS